MAHGDIAGITDTLDRLDRKLACAPCSTLPLAGAWRRYFAFHVDFVVVGAPTLAMLGLVAGVDFTDGWLASPTVVVMMLIPFVLAVCSISFKIFGNTPGKALLGLHVLAITGERPTFAQFTRRQGALFLQGLSAGIPLALFASQLWQFGEITAGRPTSYDKGKWTVVFRPIGTFGAVRIAIFCFVSVSGVVGHAYLQSLQSWKNPVTGMQARLPTGWIVREVRREDIDGLVYAFTANSPQLQGILWRDQETDATTAALVQAAKVEALIERGLVSEVGLTHAGEPAFGLSGDTEIDNQRRPVVVTLWRDGADVWQLIVVAEPGAKLDVVAAQALRRSVFPGREGSLDADNHRPPDFRPSAPKRELIPVKRTFGRLAVSANSPMLKSWFLHG